jgi:hypothetical protein
MSSLIYFLFILKIEETKNYSNEQAAASSSSVKFDFINNYNQNVDCKENRYTPTQTPIKSMFKKIQSISSLTMTTPVSTHSASSNDDAKVAAAASNRFSFSKLTKFVSRSALKVMNRKTSADSAGNSADSSLTMSPEQSPSNSILNYEEENNQMYKFNKQRSSPHVKTSYASNSMQLHDGAAKKRPVMGITALMINKHKNQQQQLNQQYGMYGLTTGVSTMMPNLYLVGLPIVFNSANLVEEKIVNNVNSNNYDRLTRPQAQSQTQLQTSSNKLKLNPPSRMSVFSKSAVAMSQIAGKPLSVNDLYDSISEAVF